MKYQIWISFDISGVIKIIMDAVAKGQLRPGGTIVEGTAGNTGIGLALVCAQKGYPLVVTMAESFSIERRKMMRFLGAKVVLTPAALKGSGMLAKAVELAEEHDWFLVRQFENEANPAYHRSTTAPEILRDFAGQRLDVFVSGVGRRLELMAVTAAHWVLLMAYAHAPRYHGELCA